MLNKEKYADEIFNIAVDGGVVAFDKEKQIVTNCGHCMNCLFYGDNCTEERRKWMNSEYVEPEVDWSKVPIDTPILVRDSKNNSWYKRHFAGIHEGKICTWNLGLTSWTTVGKDKFCKWNYAELAEPKGQ